MRNAVTKIQSKITAMQAAFMFMLMSAFNSAHAALPATQAPSTGASGGDYIGMMKGWAYDILIVGGLIICAVGFLTVASNAISVYKEIGAGKKQWGDLGMHTLAGVLLLVFIVYLITEASAVIV